jgi:hypothetical protein
LKGVIPDRWNQAYGNMNNDVSLFQKDFTPDTIVQPMELHELNTGDIISTTIILSGHAITPLYDA